MPSKTGRIAGRVAGGLMSVVLTAPVLAGGSSTLALLGYDDLVERLGGDVPTGAGIPVAQTEPVDGDGDYGPNKLGNQFIGKTFHEMSGPTGYSSHAHTVAKYQYGNGWSMARGIDQIYLWEALDWLQSGWLNTGSAGTLPMTTPDGIKCLNNSWIAVSSPTFDNEALRRADLVVVSDDLLITNGVNNDGGQSLPLFSHMYNGICVGVLDGSHQFGNTLPGYDGPGRMKPEIVGPQEYSSFATPMVNASGSLLVETARTHADLSSNPAAERTEVLKAVILTSAVHEDMHDGDWSNEPVESGPDRGFTATPIDNVVGVGTVNINLAHLVLTGAEQSGSPAVPASSNIVWRGWDLTTMVAGESRFYRYTVLADAEAVSVTATWHRKVRLQGAGVSWVADFDLKLWRVGSSGELIEMLGDLTRFTGGNVASESAIDNVEHLYIEGLQAGTYAIELARHDTLSEPSPQWDVAIAWLFPEPTMIPEDVDGDGVVGFADLILVLSSWGACPGCPEDLNGNDEVDFNDLIQLLAAWS